MSHPFGDLLSQYLHRKHGFSQAKLAARILQPPAVITDMCKGRRLTGWGARGRVVAILEALQDEDVLANLGEANALLAAAGMTGLDARQQHEGRLIARLPASVASAPTGQPSALPALSAEELAFPLAPSEELSPPVQITVPVVATPFVGRVAELARLGDLLESPTCRLITLTGAGGMGKTRLAIRAAEIFGFRFPDGICFVDLAAITSPDLVKIAIAQALQLGAARGEPHRQLLSYLRDRRLLLILDNFEHLVGGASILSDLLSAAPRLALLVTSQLRLNLREECLLPLGGLEVPPAERDPAGAPIDLASYSASALFLQIARRLEPAFQPDAAGLEQIDRICRLVRGVPLAIEMVAAWVPALPLAEIAAELEQGFTLLTTALKDMPERQRSMRATFDHSWHLLPAAKQSVLSQLSVFCGSFSREAAQAVAGADLPLLARLAETSWLCIESNGRYSMHDLVRQYCAQKLDEEYQSAAGEPSASVRERHANYYLSHLERHAPEVNRNPAEVRLLALEQGNLLAAWGWAVEYAASATVGTMALALTDVAQIAGWHRVMIETFEAAIRQWKQRAGDARTDPADDRSDTERAWLPLAEILESVSVLLQESGLPDRARACLNECLALLGSGEPDPRSVAARLEAGRLHAVFCREEGDYAEAVKLCRALLDTFNSSSPCFWPFDSDAGAYVWLTDVYYELARDFYELGDESGRRASIEQAIHFSDLAGDRRRRAACLTQLADVLASTGDHWGAEEIATEALRTCDAFGEKLWSGTMLYFRAQNAMDTGDWARARTDGECCLAIALETGHPFLHVRALKILGRAALGLGRPDEAQKLLEEALAIASGVQGGSTQAKIMPMVMLSQVALAEGDLARAKAWLGRALRIDPLSNARAAALVTEAGRVVAFEGNSERAVRMLAFVANWSGIPAYTRAAAARALHEVEAQVTLDVFAAGVAQGRACRIDELLAELNAEL